MSIYVTLYSPYAKDCFTYSRCPNIALDLLGIRTWPCIFLGICTEQYIFYMYIHGFISYLCFIFGWEVQVPQGESFFVHWGSLEGVGSRGREIISMREWIVRKWITQCLLVVSSCGCSVCSVDHNVASVWGIGLRSVGHCVDMCVLPLWSHLYIPVAPMSCCAHYDHHNNVTADFCSLIYFKAELCNIIKDILWQHWHKPSQQTDYLVISNWLESFVFWQDETHVTLMWSQSGLHVPGLIFTSHWIPEHARHMRHITRQLPWSDRLPRMPPCHSCMWMDARIISFHRRTRLYFTMTRM
jgi:hypothetical protein